MSRRRVTFVAVAIVVAAAGAVGLYLFIASTADGPTIQIRLVNESSNTFQVNCLQNFRLRPGDRQVISLNGANTGGTVCEATQLGVPYRQYELCFDGNQFRHNQLVTTDTFVGYTCP